MGSRPSEEIPVGEPIIPPYNGSKVIPVAQLLGRRGSQVIACWRRLGCRLLPLNIIMASILRMIRS